MRLTATTRTITTKSELNQLRKIGKLAGIIYGPTITPQPLSVETKVFLDIFSQTGESTLLDFVLDDQSPVKVLIKEVAVDPVTDRPIHVDFFQVDMQKPLEVEIELVFEGTPPAIKELGGILNKQLEVLEVKCLPAHLVHDIKVDISSLTTFEDSIHVKDIQVPEGIEILNNPDDVVVMVSAPISEAELAEAIASTVPEIPQGEPVVVGKEDKGELNKEEK